MGFNLNIHNRVQPEAIFIKEGDPEVEGKTYYYRTNWGHVDSEIVPLVKQWLEDGVGLTEVKARCRAAGHAFTSGKEPRHFPRNSSADPMHCEIIESTSVCEASNTHTRVVR